MLIMFFFTSLILRHVLFSFKLVFKSIRGSSFTSDMAIDDITIDAGECEEGKVINNVLLENER